MTEGNGVEGIENVNAGLKPWEAPVYVVGVTWLFGMGFSVVFSCGQFLGAPMTMAGLFGSVALFCVAIREAIL